MNLVSAANKYIQDSAPWAMAKDPAQSKQLASCMAHLAHAIYEAGTLLSPIMVEKSPELFKQLGVPEELRTYENIKNFDFLNGLKVEKGSPLFPRLDVAKEIEAIAALMAAPKEKAAA